MSYNLDPRILSKLRAFAQRRRKLLLIRGVCSALAMLLATMMLVALIDRLFVLPDEARWALSAVAYLAVLVVEWRTCLRQLTHAPGPRRLARLIEHAEPKLREDLLSAVELGTAESGKVLDSLQFRALLQDDVAGRIEDLEVDRLLPTNLLKRYIGVATALFVAMLVAFIATGFQFGTLMLRALLPGANLGRVSATQVEIVAPAPAEQVVAYGDAVPLEIKLSGRLANKALLEVFTESGKRERVQLNATGPDRFGGTIQVGRESVHYRILAGDAITRKYSLEADPRPDAIQFEKTYTPPAYTLLPPTTKTEENGDIVALEGSEVDLKLKTNVPIKDGELRLEQGRVNTVVTLIPGPDGRLTAHLPVKTSGTYRVHLVAAKTGFENKFSPEYELRAEPDLVPAVVLDLPAQDLIVPANEVVDFIGTATDDLSVAKLAQQFKVNDGPWNSLPIEIKPGPQVPFHQRWDLLQQGVRAGDMITTKIVATDLKGNHGESRPVQISITAAGFEMKRITALNAQRALAEALRVWREGAEALAKVSGETRQRVEQPGDSDAVRQSQLKIFGEAYDDFTQKHGDAVVALVTALRAAQAGHESADLVLLGRLLAKAEAGTAREGKTHNAVAATNLDKPYAKDLVRESDDAANRTVQRARVAEDAFGLMLTGEEVDVLAENLQILNREQRRLGELAKNSGKDEAKWAQLGNRLRVVLSEAKSIEELFDQVSKQTGQFGDRAKQIGGEFRKQREVVEKLFTEGGGGEKLLGPMLNLGKAVEDAVRDVLNTRGELRWKLVEMTKNVLNEVGPTWTNFEKLRTELQAFDNNPTLTPEAHEALAAGRWSQRLDLFKAHGDLEEIRPTSDAFFVSDVRATSVALQGLQTLAPGDGAEKTREKIGQLDLAFRILEGGHDLQEIHDGLTYLSGNERWQIASPRARTANVRDWFWIEGRVNWAPEQLGKLQLTAEPVRKAIEGAQKILWDVQQKGEWKEITKEMDERRQPQHEPRTTRQDADVVAAEVKRAIDLLRPFMQAAREQIAQIAPKLSELAAALAKETEQLKQETTKQEETAKDAKDAKENQPEMEKTLAQQEKLNEKVDALKDLLRADANKQNVLDAEQREHARDADDALAMLKEPPPKAEEALQDAAKAETNSAQEQALAQAAEQQNKLEKALNQIAQHFDKLEQGQNPEETRLAMRAEEQELGVKDELDQQFAKAQELAEMAQKTPEQLLAELEKALPKNPAMQQELSSISQAALAQAEKQLTQASQQESQVAQQLAQQPANAAAEAARQAAQAADAAQKAANAAEQQAKQAANDPASQQSDAAAKDANKAMQAAQQAAQSAEKMANATTPQKAAEAAQETAQHAGEAMQAAQQAAAEAKQAQATAQQAAQTAGDKQPNNQQTAQQSGEAAKDAEQAAQAAQKAQQLAQQAAQQATQQAQAMAQTQQPAQSAQQAAQQAMQAAEAAQKAAATAQQQADQAGNKPASEQAQHAAQDAGKAMQAAQQATQSAQKMAQATTPQQAAESAQQTAQQAGEAAHDAQQAAAEARQAQNTAQQAAQAGGDKQPNNQQTAQQSGDAAAKADQAAQAATAAQNAAQQVAQQAQNAANPQLAQAAQQQTPIAQNADQAGNDVARAGRHEARLQNMAAGEQLQQLGAQVQQTAEQQVPAAQQALQKAQNAAQAQAPVNTASHELGNELAQLQHATEGGQMAEPAGQQPAQAGQAAPNGQQPAGQPQNAQDGSPQDAQPQSSQPFDPTQLATLPATPLEQQWMARTLDALDQALNGPPPPGQQGQQNAQQGQQPGQQPGGQQPGQQPGPPSPAQQAMNAAQEAAQQAMNAQRSAQVSPTPKGYTPKGEQQEKSEGGTLAQAPNLKYGATPDAKNLKVGEWGKLPKQMAEQLSKGQQEGIAPEYRTQVQTYYKVIAERAKKP